MEIDLDVLWEELRHQRIVFSKDRHFRTMSDVSVVFVMALACDIVRGYQDRLITKKDGGKWRSSDEESPA